MQLSSIITNVLALAAAASAQCTNTNPKNQICGKNGVVSKPKVLASPHNAIKSLTLCRNACLSNGKCLSFGFQQGRSCVLYSATLPSMGWTPSSSSKIQYYNRSCFSGAGCPKPSPTTVKPTQTSKPTSQPTSKPTSITTSSPTSTPSKTSSSPTTTPSTTRTTTSTPTSSPSTSKTTSTPSSSSASTVTTSSPTSSPSTATTTSTSTPTASSLIRPGDFEDQSWGNWTKGFSDGISTFDITSPGYKSSYAGRISIKHEYITLGLTGISPIVIGQPYTYSWDLNFLDINCTMGVTTNEGNILSIGKHGTDSVQGAQGWQHFSQVMVPSTSTESTQMAFGCYDDDGTVPISPTFLIDNIQMTPLGNVTYSVNSPTTGPNLVTNGYFQNQDTTGWSFSPQSMSSSYVHFTPISDGSNENSISIDIGLQNGPTYTYLTKTGLQTIKDGIFLATVDYYYTQNLGTGAGGTPACSILTALGQPEITGKAPSSQPLGPKMTGATPGVGPGSWGTIQKIVTAMSASDPWFTLVKCQNGGNNTFSFRNFRLEPLN